jgi:sigma-B regulation protein RsbU (phosphoserine phosphatase)
MVVDVSQDWVAACVLQERFMENARAGTPGLAWDARCRQMRSLGGDSFQLMPLAGRHVALSVADASGKGLPAALLSANVQSSLRTAALFAPEDPAAVVTAVNRQLYACSPADRFATLFYGVFDENTRMLQYVSAGHNPALAIRRDGVELPGASSPPVGLFDETVYRAQSIQLYAGDLLVVYTDGVVEAADAAGEEWGIEGLREAIQCCGTREPDGVVDRAFAALDQFSGEKQTDDATILAALVR